MIHHTALLLLTAIISYANIHATRRSSGRSFRPPHQDQWRQGGEEVLEEDDDLAAAVGGIPWPSANFPSTKWLPSGYVKIAIENGHL